MTFPRVLVVDDDEGVRSGIAGFLEDHASEVIECQGVSDAISVLERCHVDVILCDIYMPDGTGLDLIRRAREMGRDTAFVVMTGRPALSDVITALQLHAADFLTKPFGRAQLLAVLTTAYEALVQQRMLANRFTELSSEIEAKSEKLREALFTLEVTQRSSLEALVAALDAREHELCAHSFRVRAYTGHLALCANYPRDLVSELDTSALLHDVGKIATADSILLKPGPLTDKEFEVCKKHSIVGAHILSSIPSLWRVANIVKHHHERWDGTGYPDGLRGEEIPLGARIFTIADTLDALTSDRCYRKGTSVENAQTEILRCRGTQFDPALVETFLRVPVEQWWHLRASADQSFFSGPGRSSDFGLSLVPPRQAATPPVVLV
jgi:putative nucleotidyltransferase with HDIG domain